MPTLTLSERCSETKVKEPRRGHSAERTWITGASVASEYSFIFPLHLKYSAWCINNKTMLLHYFRFADLHIFHDLPLKRNLKNISKSHENNCILSNLLIFFRLYNFVINSLNFYDLILPHTSWTTCIFHRQFNLINSIKSPPGKIYMIWFYSLRVFGFWNGY